MTALTLPLAARALEQAKEGETVEVKAFGTSMEPLVPNKSVVTLEKVTENNWPVKDDIVLAKVQGTLYLHKVTAVRNGQYQISNNKGHVNGWVGIKSVYGKIPRRKEPPAGAGVGAKLSPPDSGLTTSVKLEEPNDF